jgi:hemoglobin
MMFARAPVGMQQQELVMTQPAMIQPSLFERLGGSTAVDAAVDAFYNRVLADARIAHHFAGLDMSRQLKKQKAFLTLAFGGHSDTPRPALRHAHARLNLTESDFDAVLEHLSATLTALRVPADLIAEATSIAESVKRDVLNL